LPGGSGYTNSINDCNTSLDEDAIHRVSTDGLFVTFFFKIGIICAVTSALITQGYYKALPFRAGVSLLQT
jgi:hypothetical protein